MSPTARRFARALALAGLVAVSAFASWPASVAPIAAQTPEGAITGALPPQGIALVEWGGGSIDALVAVAASEGCDARSLWRTEDGAFIGYTVGAPAFVNARFLELSGAVLPSMPLLIVCEPEAAASGARAIEGTSCTLFPDDNPWAMRVDDLEVHPNSEAYIADILGTGGTGNLHPDFGSNPDYGIPFTVVPDQQPRVPVTFEYADESDPGPYPIPSDVAIEGGSDRHALIVTRDECVLYELFALERTGAGWQAGSGAIFDLQSNALRPDGWTSADAAGLPVFAGLARYAEVDSGRIEHALRFTVRQTQRAYIHPATHFASSVTDPDAPRWACGCGCAQTSTSPATPAMRA